MTIKEACAATGLTRKAIRYYESVGLISPDIDPNGYRNYSDDVVRQLAVIAVLARVIPSFLGFRPAIRQGIGLRPCFLHLSTLGQVPTPQNSHF